MSSVQALPQHLRHLTVEKSPLDSKHLRFTFDVVMTSVRALSEGGAVRALPTVCECEREEAAQNFSLTDNS